MSGLERLGRYIAREQDALREGSTARAQLRKRLAELEPPPARGWLRPWHGAAACTALAAAAALALWLRAPQVAPLALRIEASAQAVLPGAWLEAPAGDAALGLRFSDGTRIEMAPRTRARVVDIDGHGAHLLLESGGARVAVVRRPGAAWRLSVGPFAVRVIGTRFDVRWNPEQDEFRLDLTEGHVELSGCVFGQGYRMRAGQAVDASCRRGRFHVGDVSELQKQAAAAPDVDGSQPAPAPQLALPTPAQRAPVVSTARTPAPTRVHGRRDSPRSTAPRAASDWRVLAENGQYADAFAAARGAGFEVECARASADELALLAEVARYAGQDSQEAHALLLLRRRFAGTSRAALAAFALGRLDFDARHSYAKAARWFSTYLKEQPRGALSREARGRLIEATLAAGEHGRARSLSASYLRDHPAGPHAELARSVLERDAGLTGTVPDTR